jgi:2-keto-4-pentenoate hydratase/2-oxohepta-3-ene-1,7-dioic acid hydratase in catechol pathway
MKIVVYGPQKRLGALLEDGIVVDLNHAYTALLESKGEGRAYAKADANVPSCLLAFIEEGEAGLKAATKAIAYAKKVKVSAKGEQLLFKDCDVKLHAPIPSTDSRIAMAGANFYDHSADVSKMFGQPTSIEEIRKQVKDGKYNAWGFWKQARNVVDPDECIPYPARTQRLDYEVEVAAVLGKKGKDIEEDKGEEYIYGYTIVNDLSIRDGGRMAGPDGFFFGKNFDGCAPMGPCIVTKDEIGDVYKLKLKQTVNGKIRQNGSMESMIRKYPWWIAWISRDMYLYPGDIVCGGTCSGTALDTSPVVEGKTKPDNFLKVGDVLEAEVPGIGKLRTTIVAKK